MTETETLVLIVLVIVAVAVVIALVMMRAKSRRDDAARADELREQADLGAARTLPDAEVEAQRAEADAEQARIAAQRAEERAREARNGVVQEEAHHEDQVRAADRLDPRVDDTADDYAPTAEPTHARDATEADEPSRTDSSTGGTHRT
jgi:hypothetical protein